MTQCLQGSATRVVLLALVSIAGATPCFGNATYVEFDVPGSLATYPISMNGKNDIAGFYSDSRYRSHGFIRAEDGTISTFDPPRSHNTYAASINSTGTVAGYFQVRDHLLGFIRTGPRIVTFRVQGDYRTNVLDINDLGVVTGSYSRGGGYIRAADGTITTFFAGGATNPVSINNHGTVVGSWLDSANVSHGFVRASDGAITELDVPKAASTALSSIDNSGVITGAFTDASGRVHGFLREASGKIQRFEVPGAIYTYPLDLAHYHNQSIAAGYCHDASIHVIGFVRLADGSTETFDAPGAGGYPGQGTFAQAINASGFIAGRVEDANDVVHGFLRIP